MALTLNLDQGTVQFDLPVAVAQELQGALTTLQGQLRAIATRAAQGGTRVQEKPMEYQYRGEVFLEVFCNPNIWPNPFTAKVLITLRDDRLRLTTEASLSQILTDVGDYLSSQ